jgi:hypothetical protein
MNLDCVLLFAELAVAAFQKHGIEDAARLLLNTFPVDAEEQPVDEYDHDDNEYQHNQATAVLHSSVGDLVRSAFDRARTLRELPIERRFPMVIE